MGHFQNNLVNDDADDAHLITDSYSRGKSIVVTRVRSATRLDFIDAKKDEAGSLMLLYNDLDAFIDILTATRDRIKERERNNEE